MVLRPPRRKGQGLAADRTSGGYGRCTPDAPASRRPLTAPGGGALGLQRKGTHRVDPSPQEPGATFGADQHQCLAPWRTCTTRGVTTAAGTLTGPQRAAVVLAQLDEDTAQAVLATMSEAEVIQLTAEVAQLPALAADEVRQVVADFTSAAAAYRQVRQGGLDLAQRWLNARLGPARAAEALSEIAPTTEPTNSLEFLNRIEPAQICRFLADEHPQTVALVLTHVRRAHAARVVDQLDDELAADVVRRMATMNAVPAAVTHRVGEELGRRLSSILGVAAGETGGVKVTASVLSNLDRALEKGILSRVEAEDPDLAEALRSEMFVFDDVARLDDVSLQVVLRTVDLRTIAMALKTAEPEVVDRFLGNLSAGAAQDLAEELQSLGPQRLSVVEAAQVSLVKAVQQLAEAEAITLGRPDDELIA